MSTSCASRARAVRSRADQPFRARAPRENVLSTSNPTAWSFETRQVHAGARPDPTTGARATPIHPPGASPNPTQDVLERRVAALEGGVAAVACASGRAATVLAVLAAARPGDHVVASDADLFRRTVPELGIEVTVVEEPDGWAAAVRPNTKLFFAEALGPRGAVLDVRAVADAAHAAGVPLVVDNTVPTPYLLRPIEHGADVVVHSAAAFLGGHGTARGGVVVTSGDVQWRESPDLGSVISPQDCFLLLQGIETLSLRMERHVQNAQAVAEWLEARADVRQVHYAGLPSSPWHAAAQRYLPKGAGAVVAFELAGGAASRFLDALELHGDLGDVGDVRSQAVQQGDVIRLSVGLEGVEDITADLDAGFRAAKDD
ncbi:PLP-dependent transferase [Pseudonocardia sp. CA-107938]|uniref:PLP-dependent transferase n=1 Tax=Pseudonocardia sp. CA-107938 TaxID=3240021 RepID=UPI003D8DFE29